MRPAAHKILSLPEASKQRRALTDRGESLVFTNGTFDLLHAGHATYLEFAREQGDALFVGLNSDDSIRAIKGEKRPIVDQDNRARLLAGLECVDAVILFEENEPVKLIETLIPDVLVKGADWAHYVAGRDIVEAVGGKVVLADLVEGLSSTRIIQRILELENSEKQ